ncbi:MAG: hypothetical protein P8Z75_10060 [Gammaproteobacteria bacterium]|jgi:hypothetical protein
MDKKNIYGSGLNSEDWFFLRNVMWPFIHTEDPTSVEIAEVPHHLVKHALIENIRKYKETGEGKYLDKAGQCLIPTERSFGWYVPLTK